MGPELEEIQTEVRAIQAFSKGKHSRWDQALGFQALDGESKVRLLPTPWPTNALPPPTSSLLSVASKKGVVAAAGPESVVIASTESVRDAFKANAPSGGDIKPFQPQLTLQIGTRISQVAFSSDESVLVISAEVGGGLAVYDVQALLQGNTQSTFELATGGASVRALVPNPATTSAELFAVVTTNGDLMIANMKTQQLNAGPNGQVMKNGVSCVTWSNKGKQLVAGLGNGSASQMTPEGVGKAEIPKPEGLDGNQHGMLSPDVFGASTNTCSVFDRMARE